MKKLLFTLLICGSTANLQARDYNVDLAATMTALPQVFTEDDSEEVIQMCALLDLAGLGAKSYSLAQNGLDGLSVQDKAKLASYGAGTAYDFYAMTSPEELVTLTKKAPRAMKRVKRVQQALVLLETALRTGVLYGQKIGQNDVASLGVEGADLVGIARLMARHWPVTPENNQSGDIFTPLNQPTTTTDEVPKLSLLRDENIGASLGIKDRSPMLLHVPEDLPPFVDELPTDIEKKPVDKPKKKKKKKSVIKTVEVIDLPAVARETVEDIMFPPTPFIQRAGGTLQERLEEVERYKKWEVYCREYEAWVENRKK